MSEFDACDERFLIWELVMQAGESRLWPGWSLEKREGRFPEYAD